VLGLHCAVRDPGYALLIDLNPCAAYCAHTNTASTGLGWLIDVAQCDSISCLRCPLPRGAVIIYNTPYLPVEDEGLEALAWSGGIDEASRAARFASRCIVEGCVVLVYSSLSGNEEEVLRPLSEAGFTVKRRGIHMFFEDIVVATACRSRV